MKLKIPVSGVVTAITEREFKDAKKGIIKSVYVKVQTDKERGSADTEIVYKTDKTPLPELFEEVSVICEITDWTDKDKNTKLAIKQI